MYDEGLYDPSALIYIDISCGYIEPSETPGKF
jgi:hypothetical protein